MYSAIPDAVSELQMSLLEGWVLGMANDSVPLDYMKNRRLTLHSPPQPPPHPFSLNNFFRPSSLCALRSCTRSTTHYYPAPNRAYILCRMLGWGRNGHRHCDAIGRKFDHVTDLADVSALWLAERSRTRELHTVRNNNRLRLRYDNIAFLTLIYE